MGTRGDISISELREVETVERPYHGGNVDGPHGADVMDMWAVPVPVPPPFEDGTARVHVPRSEHIVTCGDCAGDCEVRCRSCYGSGEVKETRTRLKSSYRDGKHHVESEQYEVEVTCSRCRGAGKIQCPRCEGEGDLVIGQELAVCWRTVRAGRVLDATDLPDHIVARAEGTVALCEEDARVEPTMDGHGPMRECQLRVSAPVDAAIDALLAEHRSREPHRLHRQRVTVRAVPVVEATYVWRRKQRQFWVFGTDQKVFAPRYPLDPLRIGLLGAALMLVGIIIWLSILVGRS
jgi:eukaryotic-like serine/threonine-protein kinase